MSNAIFVQGDPEQDFFTQNPQLRYFPAVQRLLGSVAEDVASKLMWAVYLTEDINSKYYAMPYDKRRDTVAQYYLKDNEFDWESIEYLISEYPEMALSLHERWYKTLADKFSEMVRSVKDMDVVDDYTSVLAMFEKLERMIKGLDVAEAKMKQDQAKKVEGRGGSKSGLFG